jgi:hypothetical protein
VPPSSPFPKYVLTALLADNSLVVPPELAERLLTLVEERPDLVAAQVRAWLKDADGE